MWILRAILSRRDGCPPCASHNELMDRLIRLGYWRSETTPDWPDPDAFVDPGWDAEERHLMSQYFAFGTIARTFMGRSPCRFCGVANGSVEYTDGTYLWPEGLVHYLDEHDVRLPSAVVDHATARLEEAETAVVDDTWWRSLTGP